MDGWGISDGYWDVAGAWHPIDEGVRAALLAAMGADGEDRAARPATGPCGTATAPTCSPPATSGWRTAPSSRP